ncbi:WXG100 family type VII secretion target [Actinocrispum wychmicini]|uniref:ESAT-6-like protein n=1 Tax=Actinocrispum wychmicini TaxID=1213861 RepID=A0A4R2JRE6_9PSEU|nr:WXG100 family type VII secretion target [Actinocrispum wychmicini]TCO59409.1 WXG100 family type VII secretion target [Actinocrispum wychmicini]
MGKIVADFGGLVEVEQAIHQAANRLEDELSGLRARIAPLCESLWTGAAAAAYKQVQDDWDKSAEEIRDVMTGLHRIVRTARGNYSAALRANLSMWRGR